MTTVHTSEYVVVGAGLAGSATAWQLAARGHEVTVLEQGVPADPAGSSHGSARILRYAYPDPFYVNLVLRSRALWSELERASGRQLIVPTGALDFGPLREPERLAKVLEDAHVDHELLGRAEARQRFPGIAVDGPALWHPAAGVIDAVTSVHAMLGLASAAGARLMTGWRVSSVESTGTGYRVVSHGGDVVDCSRVVVTAGGWLPALLGDLGLPPSFVSALPRLTVRQEQAFHFPYRDGASPWPAFIHKAETIRTYSLPGGRDAEFRGQKLAEFAAGPSIGSAHRRDGVVDPVNRGRMIAYVRATLPGLVPEPYAETTCLFTSTPTEDFVLDRCDGITVVSPCSGHGAKFAPFIGSLAAEAAAADSAESAGELGPRRFQVDRAVA